VDRLLLGEKVFAKRFFKERLSPWKEQPRREKLQGEAPSVEKPLQGGMVFKERMSLWRDSSRREKLRGESITSVLEMASVPRQTSIWRKMNHRLAHYILGSNYVVTYEDRQIKQSS
jgi:hypothetical protein